MFCCFFFILDMEASLNKLVDENIAECLKMLSTHTDVAIRLVKLFSKMLFYKFYAHFYIFLNLALFICD